ncbi:MAG: hypothetical protein M1825_002164 [Sarcosagium campestre]|nr:MAG: hypothetical protein M1825_002164 [Sarcosagium campestre]
MSALPSGNATASTNPPRPANGNPVQQIRRRPRNADPLVRPKNPRARRPPPTQPSRNLTVPVGVGQASGLNRVNQGKPAIQPSGKLAAAAPNPTIVKPDTRGFSVPPQTEKAFYWPLYTTKRALREGLRFHVARFASKKTVQPQNEDEFTRPVRLHRRDPRAPPAGASGAKDVEVDVKASAAELKDAVLDDKERERQEIIQREKEAQKQADLAQIAPSVTQAGAPSKKPVQSNVKKTQRAYNTDLTPEAQKKAKLRYEEALPWHLEDFDNKNTWVGNYEQALSDIHVAMVPGENCFYMYPVEKWYKFTARNQFKTLTIEEAEARMGKKVRDPRWFMESQRATQQKKVEETNPVNRKLFLGKWEGSTGRPTKTSEKLETDDLDFVEDRFADDEENVLFEGDEEEREDAEERIKRDQLAANIFDLKDEKEVDKEEAEEKREQDLSKKLGKKLKKALLKREKNYIYDDDSDGNPYSEESETEDSEEERRKEEEKKKAEEKPDNKQKAKDGGGGKVPSGASTKGSTTPSSKQKQAELLKKASHLKRPGSPNMSEASGTESAARKKHKKNKAQASSQPTAATTPREGTPVPSSSAPEAKRLPPSSGRQSSIVKLPVEASKLNEISNSVPRPDGKRPRARHGSGSGSLAGSGSDAEATGAEMSDGSGGGGGRRKKPRLSRNGSPTGVGSPVGSRAASPDPTGTNRGSRATSPTIIPPTPAEILQNIPAAGISVADLTTKFKRRIVNKVKFIADVKALATIRTITAEDGTEKRVLFPK